MNKSRDQLRQRLLKTRKELGATRRAAFSQLICRRIRRSPNFLKAHHVALYLSMPQEVNVNALVTAAWKSNKQVFVPVVLGKTMEFARLTPQSRLGTNHFGIIEPQNYDAVANLNQLDLVITPLLGFDKHCNRLGMGGGFYDRAFAFLSKRSHWFRPKLVAAAFECQRTNELSPQSWDVPMWCIATETKTYQRIGAET